MRKELEVKTRSLAGSSDLTLFAPIRPGLVPSLETVSYKTRLRLLLKTLNGSRSSSAEYALVRPFSDAVERVGVIQSVRLAIVEPEDKLMLAATFDGAWETYIRVLWQKVGTLLDVIFCNTEGYVSAHGNSYEAWAGWARRVQVQTEFFYGMPGLTVDDVHYLRADERLHREFRAGPGGSHPPASAQSVQSAETRAWLAATGIAPADQRSPDAQPQPRAAMETGRQGLQALAMLYRLTDYFPTGTDDGAFLHRAARDLLLEFRQLFTPGKYPGLPEDAQAKLRFERQLGWLFGQRVAEREKLPIEALRYEAREVQGGILRPYEGVTHGCLLLVGLASREAGAKLLDGLQRLVTSEAHDADGKEPRQEPFVNLALTHEGLRRLGLGEAELERFPAEFRQGMEARAGILGDLRDNHPRRWRPPLRNWPVPPAPGTPGMEVELASVHVVVHLRIAGDGRSWHEFQNVAEVSHPLHPVIRQIASLHPGAELLSVQPMRRNFRKNSKGHDEPVEHFGFVDGMSQPTVFGGPCAGPYSDLVPLGDVLLGHANEADAAPARDALLHNGSFLVIRKLRQDVAALEAVLAQASGVGLGREQLLAKMMGRELDGTPLAAPGRVNDFDYRDDAEGRRCPFQSHVRRANPRSPDGLHVPHGGRKPRMMRRGMSYGPLYQRKPPAELNDTERAINAEERGIVFMAYNASISEQFEPIQRWLAGGNSSGVLSSQSDPFLGVPTRGDRRTFRFDHEGVPVRIDLDLKDDTPIVRLEWGAYLFVPSIPALRLLQGRAAARPQRPQPVWSPERGLLTIERLENLPRDLHVDAVSEWKLALEETDRRRLFESASVWAAIREWRGGVLRTPYGVLVAGRAQVKEVLNDAERRYSVSGYQTRMAASIGEIYLGLDRKEAGCPYDRESAAANAAIQAIGLVPAFEEALRLAREELLALCAVELARARALGGKSWELNLDLRELIDKVLARLCESWFGLSEAGGRFKRGPVPWQWRAGEPPTYPGHFTAPSRYIFQPHPGAVPEQTGREYGTALRQAMLAFVRENTRTSAPIAAAIRKAAGGLFGGELDAQNDWIARNLLGVLMGMLPTVDGSLRAVLNEWLGDGTFWRLRSALPQGMAGKEAEHAQALLLPELERSMQLRPVPELVWRTATCAHRLGPVQVQPGDAIVVSLVSATHEALAEGRNDVMPIFGGVRRAVSDAPRKGDPTHACPGYAAARGVMLGIAMALLESKDTVRPSPAPVALTFTGPVA